MSKVEKVERGKKGQGESTKLRHMRIDDEIWLPFGEACGAIEKDRSVVTRELMAWFARLPGAKMPKRPETPEA